MCKLGVRNSVSESMGLEKYVRKEGIRAYVPNYEWQEKDLATHDVELKVGEVSVWVRHLWECSPPWEKWPHPVSPELTGQPPSLEGCQRHLSVILKNQDGGKAIWVSGDSIEMNTLANDGKVITVKCSVDLQERHIYRTLGGIPSKF